MPPPPASGGRFPAMGPNSISPYHPQQQQQQYQPQQQQQHAASQQQHVPLPPMSANPNSYLNQQNQGVNAFGANSSLMGFSSGLNTPGGGGMGGAQGDNTGLASHAARMGFAHAGQLPGQQQQQQQHPGQQQGPMLGGDLQTARGQAKGRIREVWAHNLKEEMATLRDLVDQYPYIAMDTEFPGIVSRPMGAFRGKSDYHYQCLRVNVDMLKIIQIGLTLFNEKGETPPARPLSQDSTDLQSSGASRSTNGRQQGGGPFPYAWQFNFKFSLKEDMYNQTSIESLQQAGIDFNLLEKEGIDPLEFAALLIPSGLVCFENVRWISFHGGYDFGYLTKLLICRQLPNDEFEFDRLMKLYFPATYDVKHLTKHAGRLHSSGAVPPSLDPAAAEILAKFEHKSGLENIADSLKIKRVGTPHQAGSDSLLTGRVFFALRERIYGGSITDDHIGRVWGLGVPEYTVASATAPLTTSDSTPPPGRNHNTNGSSSEQQNGTPSTPNNGSVGLAQQQQQQTPAGAGQSQAQGQQHQQHNQQQQQQGQGQGQMGGPMTPGGGGGVFGSFQFAGGRN